MKSGSQWRANTAQFHLPEVSKGKFREAESRRVVPRTGRRVCLMVIKFLLQDGKVLETS